MPMPVREQLASGGARGRDRRARRAAQRWLVEGLWGDSSVGVIGGAPKCAKTWLGLDLALSVATGTACLGKYAVPQPGPVLVYLAEDALPMVGERLAGMARHRGLDLAAVEVHVITAPVLRLDRDPDRTRLLETARRLRPRLLLLDPLVRLHGIDENHAGEVAGLLAYFRSLQRQLDLVGHAGPSHAQERRGGSGRRAGPARFQRHPRLRRLEPLPPAQPRTTWCSPASIARRRPRRRSLWNWSRPTRRRPTWRSSRSCRRASDGGLQEQVLELLAGGRGADASQAPRSPGGEERAPGRGAGVAGTGRPSVPHAGGLATRD